MSLAIDSNRIEKVLLPGGWVTVDEGTFFLDAYEFMEDDRASFFGGQEPKLVPATGAGFKCNGKVICCPITSILAVQLK